MLHMQPEDHMGFSYTDSSAIYKFHLLAGLRRCYASGQWLSQLSGYQSGLGFPQSLWHRGISEQR